MQVEIDESQLWPLVKKLVVETDGELATKDLLSVSFGGDEPMVLFCPEWPINYSVELPLQKLLENEMDCCKENDEAEQVVLLGQLIDLIKKTKHKEGD